MATYVLVHGAWSGAHCFRHVRKILQDAGHRVTTPSLTGLGERVHLASQQVNLSTHVRDVVNHILYEDLQNIVLVGYSYGGLVVTGALEHISDRVQHLVYLDAFVPKDGESLIGLVYGIGKQKIQIGEQWLIEAAAREFDDPAEGDWIEKRRTPQPSECFIEPVRLEKPVEEFPFSRTYIKAAVTAEGESAVEEFWRVAKLAKASPLWNYYEVDTNHMLASNKPVETSAILLEVANN